MSAFYNKIKSISDSAYQQCKEEVISQICPKIDDLMLNNASTHSGVTVVFPLSGHAYGTSPGVSNVIYIGGSNPSRSVLFFNPNQRFFKEVWN